MIRIVFTWVGTAASILGLVIADWPTALEHQGWLVAVSMMLSIGLIWDVAAHLRHRPKTLRTADEIKRYMHAWIRGGGRVVVFTRDMTWVDSADIKSLLMEKARAHELTICLPSGIPLTAELAAEGASIITYEELGYVPTSRFTIVNDGRGDSHVAVGRRIDGKHVIEEFSLGSHAVFSVAKDLVEILRKRSQP